MSDAITAERPNATNRPRATTGETVTVACKMPNGLILRNFQFIEMRETVPNGERTVRIAEQVGEDVTLNGFAISVADVMAGRATGQIVAGGFGLTPGVPKDFWDAWYEANKNTALVRNGIVFASKSGSGAQGAALERASDVRSGLEPMDPDNLPPAFRRQRTPGGGVTGVQRMTQGNDADNL